MKLYYDIILMKMLKNALKESFWDSYEINYCGTEIHSVFHRAPR